MYEPGRSKNPCTAIKLIILQVFNFKQGETKTLTDYHKRFKQHDDLVEQMVGTHMLDGYVKSTPAYVAEADVDVWQAMKDNDFGVHDLSVPEWGGLMQVWIFA